MTSLNQNRTQTPILIILQISFSKWDTTITRVSLLKRKEQINHLKTHMLPTTPNLIVLKLAKCQLLKSIMIFTSKIIKACLSCKVRWKTWSLIRLKGKRILRKWWSALANLRRWRLSYFKRESTPILEHFASILKMFWLEKLIYLMMKNFKIWKRLLTLNFMIISFAQKMNLQSKIQSLRNNFNISMLSKSLTKIVT